MTTAPTDHISVGGYPLILIAASFAFSADKISLIGHVGREVRLTIYPADTIQVSCLIQEQPCCYSWVDRSSILDVIEGGIWRLTKGSYTPSEDAVIVDDPDLLEQLDKLIQDAWDVLYNYREE